jgi:hypothetical protein
LARLWRIALEILDDRILIGRNDRLLALRTGEHRRVAVVGDE